MTAQPTINRESLTFAIAVESYVRFRPIDPSFNLIPRRDLKCTLPRKTQLITAAVSRPL